MPWLPTCGTTRGQSGAQVSSPRPELAKLDGFSPAQTYRVLYELALNVPAEQAIIELGTFHAKGAIYLAEGAAHGGGAHVWTVDPHDLPGYRTTTGSGPVRNRIDYTDPKHRRLAEKQINDSGHSERITLVRGFSVDDGRAWGGPEVGVLSIDGNHYEQHVRLAFTAWERHLAPGAIVCFDDYRKAFPGVINVVAHLVDKGVITEPTAISSLAVTSRR